MRVVPACICPPLLLTSLPHAAPLRRPFRLVDCSPRRPLPQRLLHRRLRRVAAVRTMCCWTTRTKRGWRADSKQRYANCAHIQTHVHASQSAAHSLTYSPPLPSPASLPPLCVCGPLQDDTPSLSVEQRMQEAFGIESQHSQLNSPHSTSLLQSTASLGHSATQPLTPR